MKLSGQGEEENLDTHGQRRNMIKIYLNKKMYVGKKDTLLPPTEHVP